MPPLVWFCGFVVAGLGFINVFMFDGLLSAVLIACLASYVFGRSLLLASFLLFLLPFVPVTFCSAASCSAASCPVTFCSAASCLCCLLFLLPSVFLSTQIAALCLVAGFWSTYLVPLVGVASGAWEMDLAHGRWIWHMGDGSGAWGMGSYGVILMDG
jgi:hypothetical protein